MKKKADRTPQEGETIKTLNRAHNQKYHRKSNIDDEKWAEYLRKQRERRAKRKAAGIIYASETPEYTKTKAKEWRERHRGEERYTLMRLSAQKRYRSHKKDRHRDPVKAAASRKRYNEKLKSLGVKRLSDLPDKKHSNIIGDPGTFILRAVNTALAGRYGEADRADIACESVLAFMEGEATTLREAVAIGMKRHWRMFSKFTTASLDAEIGEGLRLIDLIDNERMRV